MPDTCLLSAVELSEMIGQRKISPSELLEAYVARIEMFNPRLNAVVYKDFERARGVARAADDLVAKGGELPPLFGLPCTIKDAFEVAGMKSTGGILELKDHVPDRDADAVALARGAGANIIGKSNVPRASCDFQSFNKIYGVTNNPYDLDRTPGGSSGGPATAVAAGMSAFEIGSDIGGSIRLPAHFCGLFGLKTSYGIVPMRGHIPPLPGSLAPSDLSVAGPLTRSAMDLALIIDSITGPADNNPAWRPDIPAARRTDPENLRIAVWLEDDFTHVDNESVALIEAAANALGKAGAKVDFKGRPDFTLREAFVNYVLIMYAIVASDLPEHIQTDMIEAAKHVDPQDTSHTALQARASALNYSQWLTLNQTREIHRAKWADFFKSYDALFCPVAPVPAFRHDHQRLTKRRLDVNGTEQPYLDVIHWAGLATGSFLPAAVAPIGQTKTGLPIGVQIVGPWLEDRTPIAIAAILEDLIGGFVPASGFA